MTMTSKKESTTEQDAQSMQPQAHVIIPSKMRAACVEVGALLKTLSHPERLMILGHLTSGEKNVGELAQACEISQSQTSQFLTRMKTEGLLITKRDGQHQYYSIADQKLSKLLSILQELYCK